MALVIHPNERSLLGTYELTERLAPALDAGMLLPDPHEVGLRPDRRGRPGHGPRFGRPVLLRRPGTPVVSVHPGGGELIPGSPMGVLLDAIPRLARAEDIADALRAYRPGPGTPPFGPRSRPPVTPWTGCAPSCTTCSASRRPPTASCPAAAPPTPARACPRRSTSMWRPRRAVSGHRHPVGVGPPATTWRWSTAPPVSNSPVPQACCTAAHSRRPPRPWSWPGPPTGGRGTLCPPTRAAVPPRPCCRPASACSGSAAMSGRTPSRSNPGPRRAGSRGSTRPSRCRPYTPDWSPPSPPRTAAPR
ncbi:hypothetical protein NKH77_16745 [Streptomyces sp. M19]